LDALWVKRNREIKKNHKKRLPEVYLLAASIKRLYCLLTPLQV
jgi:hypothetical protein